MRCAVFGCNNDNQSKNFDRNIRFFTFPKDKKQEQEWIRLCKRKDKFNALSARICSIHFVANDYVRNLMHELLGYLPRNGRIRALKSEAVPSINLPLQQEVKKNDDRKHRHEQKRRKEVTDELLNRYVNIMDKLHFIIIKQTHHTHTYIGKFFIQFY